MRINCSEQSLYFSMLKWKINNSYVNLICAKPQKKLFCFHCCSFRSKRSSRSPRIESVTKEKVWKYQLWECFMLLIQNIILHLWTNKCHLWPVTWWIMGVRPSWLFCVIAWHISLLYLAFYHLYFVCMCVWCWAYSVSSLESYPMPR